MPVAWPQVNQVHKVEEESLSPLCHSPSSPPIPSKVSGQPLHTDPSKRRHPPWIIRQAQTPPGSSSVHPGWARSPPCSVLLLPGAEEGLPPAESEAEQRLEVPRREKTVNLWQARGVGPIGSLGLSPGPSPAP